MRMLDIDQPWADGGAEAWSIAPVQLVQQNTCGLMGRWDETCQGV